MRVCYIGSLQDDCDDDDDNDDEDYSIVLEVIRSMIYQINPSAT